MGKIINLTIISRIERKLLRIARNAYLKVKKKNIFYKTTIGDDDVSIYIKDQLLASNPIMIARFGSSEFACITYSHLLKMKRYNKWMLFITGYVDFYKANDELKKSLLDWLCSQSGFFPNNADLLEEFYELMLKDVKEIDILGVWLREEIFDSLLRNKQKVNLPMLEPYYDANPWTEALSGKKVLVIHPFAQTIEDQYKKRHLLFEDQRILPQFQLKTIKAVQTIAHSNTEFANWFDALNHMKNQISECDFEIAIIGCGAYGFPLAAHVKRIGKKAIHLGGATQILFGIKGKRWENIPAVNQLMNDYWVRPNQNETPKGNEIVEDGAYW